MKIDGKVEPPLRSAPTTFPTAIVGSSSGAGQAKAEPLPITTVNRVPRTDPFPGFGGGGGFAGAGAGGRIP